ncbi:MAG: hypothetical protein JW854_06145 [Actinobacteria bacterium]|nr:hypothetical protein [Actinomycetota bacterium]
MNCPWHPNKRAIASCKDCGADFCIECVRETDQTTLCPDCFRRKINSIAREFTEPDERREESRAAPVSALPVEIPEEKPRPAAIEEKDLPPPAPAAPRIKREKRRKKDKGKKKEPAAEPQVPEATKDDFLAQGPDDDFSQLATDSGRKSKWSRRSKGAGAVAEEVAEAPRAREEDESAPPVEAAETPRVQEKTPQKPTAETGPPVAEASALAEDALLQDVMSTLLKPEAGGAELTPAVAPEKQAAVAPTAKTTAGPKAGKREARALAREARASKKEARARKKEERVPKERDLERWSFLAQPRSSQYTLIAVNWWRATIFIALMLLLGAVLWAVPNAYLIPKDQEYGIHAVAIGFIIGIAFWWKAGKKHSTKLAVQASLTTLFALFIGEFLHWFLIITKYSALRTIFFDLISFKFLWENGADIMRYTMEAMFPIAFLWLLFLPTLTAFIVGFGMPPIPEVFVQIWRALKGNVAEEKEASHGLEG